MLAEKPATAATYSMFVVELRASKSSFPSNGARVTRRALRFNNDTRILEIQGADQLECGEMYFGHEMKDN